MECHHMYLRMAGSESVKMSDDEMSPASINDGAGAGDKKVWHLLC